MQLYPEPYFARLALAADRRRRRGGVATPTPARSTPG